MKRLAYLVLLSLWSSNVYAATLTWDSNPSLAGVQDGSGNWGPFVTNNWNNGSNVPWINSIQDTAVFGSGIGAAGTVTLSSVTADDITFNPPGTGNYTLTGGTLTLAGSPVVTTNVAATIRSKLAGTGGFTKRGSGTLHLQAGTNGQQNPISGTVTIEAGTLVIGGGTNSFARDFAMRGNVYVRSGGTLRLEQSEVLGSPYDSPLISIDSGGSFELSGHDETIGFLIGQGSVSVTSGNLLTISGQNPSLTSVAFSGTLSGGGGVHFRSLPSQSWYFHTGDSSYSGATLIGGNDSGTPTLFIPRIADGGTASPLGQSSASPDNLQFNKGRLVYTGADASTNRGARFEGHGSIEVTKPDTELTFGGVVTTGGASNVEQKALTKRGAGTLILSGGANNTGATVVVEEGTLVLAKASTPSVHAIDAQGDGLRTLGGTHVRLAGSGNDQLSATTRVSLLGSLDLNARSEGFDTLTGTGRIFNSMPETVSSLILGESHGSSTFRGIIEDGSGRTSVVKAGTGTIVLDGTNSYSGGTVVDGGTLVLSRPTKAAALTVNSGGAIVTTGTFESVSTAAGGSLTIDSSPFGGAAHELIGSSVTFGAGSTTAYFDMGIPSGGELSHDRIYAEGDLSLQGMANVVLQIGAGGLANGTYTLFTYGGSIHGSEANLTVADNRNYRQVLSFLPTATTPGSVALSVSGSTADLTWRGATQGSIWGVSDLAGTANWNNSGIADKFYHLDKVRFDDTGGASSNVVLRGDLNPTSIDVDNDTVQYTFEGTGSLTRGTTLRKSGPGTLLIATANTYTGGTLVSEGVLRIANPAALGTGTVTVTGGGTLDLNGVTLASGSGTLSISGGGADGQGALINNGTVPLTGTNGLKNLTLLGDATIGGLTDWGLTAGTVVNGGNYTLTKVGANDVVWNASSNTTLGKILVTQGRMVLDGSNNLGDVSSEIIVRNGAELTTIGALNQSKPLVLEGGRFSSSSTGSSYWNGPISLNGGNNVLTTITTPGAASSYGFVLTGKITGPGGLEKLGPGILELRSGSNDYSGPTLIREGTLRIDGAGELPFGTALQVHSQLFLPGKPQTVSHLSGGGVINGKPSTLIVHQSENTEFSGQMYSVTLRKSGTGILSLTGQSASSPQVQVEEGTLVLAKVNSSTITGSRSPGAIGLMVNNTGTVRLSGTGGNQIDDDAEVSLNDGGTLDLAGMSEAIDGLLGNGGRITNSGSQASTLEIGTDGNYHTPNSTASFSGTIEDGNSPVSLIFHRGTQILEGIYSHTGPTTVRSSLIVNGTISHSPISVQAGWLSGVGQLNSVLFVSGILSPGASPRAGNPGTISIDTLSFAGSPTVQVDVGSSAPGGSPSDLILVQGNLNFHDQTKFEFNLSDGYLAPGDYPLIRYSGVLTGTNAEVKIVSDGFGAGIPERTRQTFTIDAVGTPGAVLLRVAGNSASLRWQGDGNSETLSDLWNFEDTNWWESERFHNLDSVTFDDTGAVTSPRITIDGPITFGSKLIVNNSTGHDYWFSGGSLRGNGRLIKSGAGTLHINGTSAEHTGGTLISQGTILFGGYSLGTAAITLGDSETGSRDVALLLTGKLNPVTVSPAIRVSEEGTGDVTLGAVSTTSTGSYQFRGPLILDRPTTLTHSGTGGGVDYFGPISGNVGTLTVTGGNTTVLLAVNTFLGDIVITGDGTVLSSGGNSIPAGTNVDIGPGARLEPYKAVVNVLTGSGSVRALTIGFGNGSGTFDGEVIGAGTLTKVGTGTQTLAGDSPFTGTLQIDEGKLIVNGKMSGSRVEVTGAGTLAGNGSVGHVTLQTGSRLAPGDGLGTLSANSLKWYGGAWLDFQLAAGDSSDLLSLGSGSLMKEEGSTFAFDFGGTGEANTAYVLATFSSTSFQASDFSYRNLAPGLSGSFLLTSSTLSFTTVPEPSGFALLIVASSLLGACRFPRRAR